AEPWRLQLLVQRRTGALDKAFTTFEMGYQPPEASFLPLAPVAAAPAATQAAPAPDLTVHETPLWQRVWQARLVEIGILAVAIGGVAYLWAEGLVRYF
ncbi:MAG: regulatory protein NosR, partial [Acidimicrobiia bacterium]|nr:regulatory protein NosR [Acidimicrobiia bacterium]